MRWLITGANGQLGQCMARLLNENGVDFKALDSVGLDITKAEDVKFVLDEYKPNIVVNAAAYTAVDKAESESESAYAVNCTGPGNLAQWCAKNDSRFLHVSTDYVFSGEGVKAWRESDETHPSSVYGASKLDGERAVLEALEGATIVRTAWVFSEFGNNFLKTMVRLAKERDELGVVADQIGCPTYAGDIANALFELAGKPVEESQGVFHYTGDVAVSWWGFAREIFRQARLVGIIDKEPILNRIATEDYPTPAKRPGFSVLDCSKIENQEILLSDWKYSVRSVLQRLL